MTNEDKIPLETHSEALKATETTLQVDFEIGNSVISVFPKIKKKYREDEAKSLSGVAASSNQRVLTFQVLDKYRMMTESFIIHQSACKSKCWSLQAKVQGFLLLATT
jgi:pyruvate/oxaloacetate carboxyltransferase